MPATAGHVVLHIDLIIVATADLFKPYAISLSKLEHVSSVTMGNRSISRAVNVQKRFRAYLSSKTYW